MIFFFFITLLIIFFTSLYFKKIKKTKNGFLIFFFYVLTFTGILYFTKGNIETFHFEKELNENIRKVLNDPDKLKDIDPKIIITFLEKKLKKTPDDLNGWLILARTCVIGGFYQKADLHYKTALKNFPNNKNLLLEYSILKKNTNQTKSAMYYLLKVKSLYPKDEKARELIIDILLKNNKEKAAEKEINELFILKNEDENYLKYLRKKFNLQ